MSSLVLVLSTLVDQCWVEIVSTCFYVQSIVHELHEIFIPINQINLIGIDNQQWRRIVVEKEFAVYLI
jgi:hypothetical protein